MTPAEFTAARAALGYTQGGLASVLGVGRRAVQYYEAGNRAIPEPIARIIRLGLIDKTILTRLRDG